MVSQRTIARLEARIHERAAHCLEFEIADPRASFITITRVELSSDLSSGKIHYSVLGDASDRSKAKHMLESAAGYIQRRVARVLEMRRMPFLKWIYDDSIEQAAKLDEMIHQALKRDEEIHVKGHAETEDAEKPWQAEYDEFELDDDDDGEMKPKRRH
ncbi:MAG: 30S ribosome-binding factor RbfA [Planctomycetes bacterium]|nr:30S ribosome-binding factor RbfA [Planctomycetota bacterium]